MIPMRPGSRATAALLALLGLASVSVSTAAPAADQKEAAAFAVIAEAQERGEYWALCLSREPGAYVIRHRALPKNVPAPELEKRSCRADPIHRALSDGLRVDLQNVVIHDVVDFSRSPAKSKDEIPDLNDEQRGRLWKVLEERTNLVDDPPPTPGMKFRPILKSVSITNSLLRGAVADSADRIIFLEAFSLNGTSFLGPADFSRVMFRKQATFRQAHFEDASFARAHFDYGALFSEAVFARGANFESAIFGNGQLSLTGNEEGSLSESGLFDGARFAERADFDSAVFFRRASFRGAVFTGQAEFTRASFRNDAIFASTSSTRLTFDGATVEGAASFENAVVTGQASFERAHLLGPADLSIRKAAEVNVRDAEIGTPLAMAAGRLIRWLGLASGSGVHHGNAVPRYDVVGAGIDNKRRVLARAHFYQNSVFALSIGLHVVAGVLVCFVLRPRPLLKWKDAGLEVKLDEGGSRWQRASPHDVFRERSLLVGALYVLIIGLTHHYYSHIGERVDWIVSGVIPPAIFVVWAVATVAFSMIAFASRTPWHAFSAIASASPARRRVVSRLRRSAAASTTPTPASDPPAAGGPDLAALGSEFKLAYHAPRRDSDEFARKFSESIHTAVVGIAGPRGVGKSALARAVVERIRRRPAKERDLLGFSMVASVHGDEFAFLTGLFRRTCREIQRDLHEKIFLPDQPLGAGPEADRVRRAAGELTTLPILAGLIPLILIVVATPLYMTSLWSDFPFGRCLTQASGCALETLPLLLLGAFGVCAALLYAGSLGEIARRRRQLQEVKPGQLLLETEEQLNALAFEREISEQREGGLTFAQVLNMKFGRSDRWKERTRTLSDLVQVFEDYMDIVRQVYPRGLVIHLDEVDKLEQVAAVRMFLNRLKGVFTVPGLLYLITVSEEMLEAYRLRTLGTPEAVDSCFDELLVVSPLRVAEGMEVLDKRGFLQFDRRWTEIALLACIVSGGIAREILRLARRVSLDGSAKSLSELVDVVRDELDNTVTSAVRTSTAIPDSWKSWALRDLAARNGENPWKHLEEHVKDVATGHEGAWRVLEAYRERLVFVHENLDRVKRDVPRIEAWARRVGDALANLGGPHGGALKGFVEEIAPDADDLRRGFIFAGLTSLRTLEPVPER